MYLEACYICFPISMCIFIVTKDNHKKNIFYNEYSHTGIW